MPRLGSNVGGPSPPRRRNSHRSPLQRLFGGNNSKLFSPRNIVIFVAAFFVMRNLLRRDYRREEIQYLRDSGMTEEQIHRFVPRTSEEQRKYVQDKTNDVEKMKKDIAYLLNEVAELKTQTRDARQQPSQDQQRVPVKDQDLSENKSPSNETGGNGREDALKSVDKIHIEKRRRQEDELLKSNPDFHASKRLKDMTQEEIQKALKQ